MKYKNMKFRLLFALTTDLLVVSTPILADDTSLSGINDNGVVVGSYQTSGGVQQSFEYNLGANTLTLLNNPNAAPDFTYVTGLNNNGDVVGYYSAVANGAANGFVYNQSTQSYTTINDPNANTSWGTLANGINNSGQVVGTYYDGVGFQGFEFNPTTNSYSTLYDPNTTYGGYVSTYNTGATSIIDNGVIVGYFSVTTYPLYQLAYEYNPSTNTYTTLEDVNGKSGTGAAGINANGVVVGQIQGADGTDKGFVYNPLTNAYTTLNPPNATWSDAVGINASGLVVGAYNDANGVQHGYVYNPATNSYTIIDEINGVIYSSTVSSVPVPTAIWLFGSVFAGFICINGRKHY